VFSRWSRGLGVLAPHCPSRVERVEHNIIESTVHCEQSETSCWHNGSCSNLQDEVLTSPFRPNAQNIPWLTTPQSSLNNPPSLDPSSQHPLQQPLPISKSGKPLLKPSMPSPSPQIPQPPPPHPSPSIHPPTNPPPSTTTYQPTTPPSPQTTPATPSDAYTILAAQRRLRPVSPHLTIYRPQITWYGSALNRITASLLSGGVYIFGAAYLVSPLVGWHLESASMAEWFGGFSALSKGVMKGMVSLPFTYHCWSGVRHLVWDSGREFANRRVMIGGWVTVGLTVVSSGILAFV